MLELLQNYLLSHWRQLPEAGSTPKRLTFFGQATGVSKVCFFVFTDDKSAPRYIIKMPRSPAYNDSLLQEVSTIERLRGRVSENLRQTLPGPMHTTQLHGQCIVIEPVLRGRPMHSSMPRDRSVDRATATSQVSLAHEWLVAIQQAAVHRSRELDAATVQQHFLEPLTLMQRQTELTESEGNYIQLLINDVRALEGTNLPLYLYHGDFRPGNILVNSHRIAVLDWEFSRPLAPPLLDWFSFVFRLYSGWQCLPDIDGSLDKYRVAFHEVFFTRNWFSELVADYTRAYCKALSIDETYLPLLFSLFAVNNINHFHSFLAQRAGRGYLYLLRGSPLSGQSWKRQLRRQAYVWLLSEIAEKRKLWP